MKNNVAVGFSGGIDSLMTAVLLKDRGFNVYCVTFIINDVHKTSDFQSSIIQIMQDIDIEHEFVDISMQFKSSVISYFKESYLEGATPNPCTYCNIHVKWPELQKFARQMNCQYISMGHYVKKVKYRNSYVLKKGIDDNKDQSFFLWNLNSSDLKNIIFPLGIYTKETVKLMALKRGLVYSLSKKESTGPCFVDGDYRDALKTMSLDSELPGAGNIIDDDGTVIGRHKGFPFYTISQRHGLGLNLNKSVFVSKINSKDNTITVSHPSKLWSSRFEVSNYNVVVEDVLFSEIVEVKIRYRNQKALGRVEIINNRLCVSLQSPEWAVTVGQTVAFYYNNILIGGGFIYKVD